MTVNFENEKEKYKFVNMPKSSHILGFYRIFETTSNIAKLATSFMRKVGVKKALLVMIYYKA